MPTVAPETWQPDGEFLLDVRDADEVAEFGKLQDAVNIPLGELRDRLGELPHDRRIVAYCQKGQRGYLAACLLRGHGFENVANLRGGFLQAKLNGLSTAPVKQAKSDGWEQMEAGHRHDVAFSQARRPIPH